MYPGRWKFFSLSNNNNLIWKTSIVKNIYIFFKVNCSIGAQFFRGSWEAVCAYTHVYTHLVAWQQLLKWQSSKFQDCAGITDSQISVSWQPPCQKLCRWPKENVNFITIQLKSSGSYRWKFTADLLCCLSRMERQTHIRVWVKEKILKPNM